MLHQIECLADYIYTIQENKESLIKKSIEEVKSLSIAFDEAKLQVEISTDIDRFYALVTKLIHKNAVFGFSEENVTNLRRYETTDYILQFCLLNSRMNTP